MTEQAIGSDVLWLETRRDARRGGLQTSARWEEAVGVLEICMQRVRQCKVGGLSLFLARIVIGFDSKSVEGNTGWNLQFDSDQLLESTAPLRPFLPFCPELFFFMPSVTYDSHACPDQIKYFSR
jgi:hypothetical protein